VGSWHKAPFSKTFPGRTLREPSKGDRSANAFLHYSKRGGALGKEDFARLDEDFRIELLPGKLTKRAMELAEELLIETLPIHRYRPPAPCPPGLSQRLIADICEDTVPDIGIFAREQVFGPFKSEQCLDILSGAVLSLSPLLAGNLLPLGRFCRQRPRPPKRLGRQFATLARTPAMLWRLDRGPPEPMLPLYGTYRPEGKVAGLPDAPAMVARIAATESGPEACCVMPMPLVDPSHPLERIRIEWLRLQRHCFPFFWEDLLCYRSELLYRSACEWGWTHARKEVIRCWHGS
jgi:hypothetical protein